MPTAMQRHWRIPGGSVEDVALSEGLGVVKISVIQLGLRHILEKRYDFKNEHEKGYVTVQKKPLKKDVICKICPAT